MRMCDDPSGTFATAVRHRYADTHLPVGLYAQTDE